MPQEFGCASYIALEYYPAAGLSHQIAFDRFAGASSSIESDGFSNSFLIFSERAFFAFVYGKHHRCYLLYPPTFLAHFCLITDFVSHRNIDILP